MRITLEKLKIAGVSDFIEITNILKQNNIKYWLDYGTLLGCIREKEALKWDGEFDISLWNDELDKFISIIDVFEENNFLVELHEGDYYLKELKYANIKIVNKTNISQGSFTVDVHFYLKEDKFAKRPFGGFLFKNYLLQKMTDVFQYNSYVIPFYVKSTKRYSECIVLNYATIYNILLKKYSIKEIEDEVIYREIKFSNIEASIRKGVKIEFPKCSEVIINTEGIHSFKIIRIIGLLFSYMPLWFIKLFNPLFTYINIHSEKIFKKEVIVKATFFQSFTEMEFHGTKQPVPKRFEEYLETVYGDWRTPKMNWESSTDSEVFH
jgi:phosphorylcholine metabolism protein LicD